MGLGLQGEPGPDLSIPGRHLRGGRPSIAHSSVVNGAMIRALKPGSEDAIGYGFALGIETPGKASLSTDKNEGRWRGGSWFQEPDSSMGLGLEGEMETDPSIPGLHLPGDTVHNATTSLTQAQSQASLSTDKNEGRWRGGSWFQEPDSSMGLGLEGETETDPSIPGLHLPGDTVRNATTSLTLALATQRRSRRLISAPEDSVGRDRLLGWRLPDRRLILSRRLVRTRGAGGWVLVSRARLIHGSRIGGRDGDRPLDTWASFTWGHGPQCDDIVDAGAGDTAALPALKQRAGESVGRDRLLGWRLPDRGAGGVGLGFKSQTHPWASDWRARRDPGPWLQVPDSYMGLGLQGEPGPDLSIPGRHLWGGRPSIAHSSVVNGAMIRALKPGLGWRPPESAPASLPIDKNEGSRQGGTWIQGPYSSMGLGSMGQTHPLNGGSRQGGSLIQDPDLSMGLGSKSQTHPWVSDWRARRRPSPRYPGVMYASPCHHVTNSAHQSADNRAPSPALRPCFDDSVGCRMARDPQKSAQASLPIDKNEGTGRLGLGLKSQTPIGVLDPRARRGSISRCLGALNAHSSADDSAMIPALKPGVMMQPATGPHPGWRPPEGIGSNLARFPISLPSDVDKGASGSGLGPKSRTSVGV
ncbi:hypothetical protein DFP72DRAFT_839571 [Ephemerocybe angulata]|uniref:Uncharacterized protein n=1 Tax=Ephemerocybe angulata TaxID=980116 RepID=A0A8H6MDX0_9AGAR|nr:hypothetical protein DFP72DRAFT_839571 [Tulosesus angulatus]